MSELKVNKISPRSGTAITLGDSGDTFTIPSGATLAIAGSVTGFTSAGIDDNATSVAITINSSEQVGIGTTSPDHLLHISASSSNAQLKLQRTGSATASYNISASSDSLAFSDQVAGTERMRLTSTGLGIGTSNPTHDLTVDGGTSTSVSLIKDATGAATVRYYDGGSQKAYIQLTSSEDMDFYAASGVDQIFYGNGAEVMRLSSGAVFNEGSGDRDFRVESNNNTHMLFVDGGTDRVGVGTASPDRELTVGGVSNARIGILSNDNSTGASQLQFGDPDNSQIGRIYYEHSDNSMRLHTNNTEAMRIDSSGNLLVGKTNQTANVSGTEIEGSGTIVSTRDNNTNMFLNRKTSDGQLINFRKDNSVVGSIGTASGKLNLGTENCQIRFRDDLTALTPANSDGSNSDNDIDLGYSTIRWRRLYLSEGVFLGGTGTANKLDDYEEGTWTPALKISGDTAGITYSVQAGHYTKIGNRVIANLEILLTSKGSNTGNVALIGLPFSTDNDNHQTGYAYNDRVSAPNGDIQPYLNKNTTTGTFYQSRTDGTSNGHITGNEMNDTSYLLVSFVYRTA